MIHTHTAIRLQERGLLTFYEPSLSASSWELWVGIGLVLILADLILRVWVTLPLGVSAFLMVPILWATPRAGSSSVLVWLGVAALVWISPRVWRRVLLKFSGRTTEIFRKNDHKPVAKNKRKA